MQTVPINAVAAAQAATLVFGEQGRAVLENTYAVLDGAMRQAAEEAYTAGRQQGVIEAQAVERVNAELAAEDDAAYDHGNISGYVEGYGDGLKDLTVECKASFDAGYRKGLEVATGSEQPDVVIFPAKEGDSGDETWDPSDIRSIPLWRAVRDHLKTFMDTTEDETEGADRFMRNWLAKLHR